MNNNIVRVALFLSVAVLAGSGFLLTWAQEPPPAEPAEELKEELKVDHSDCDFFGPQRHKYTAAEWRDRFRWSVLTEEVTRQLPPVDPPAEGIVPGGSRTNSFQQLGELGTIDRHLLEAMRAAGVAPAERTGDFEFIRRVTLDLTGRLPLGERVQQFVADVRPDKRARLVEELLQKPEWVDKWTMFFGDLLKNTANTSQVARYAQGRDAFYRWMRDSLAANKRYDRMVTELITATGTNSYEQGELNWLVGGRVTGGPNQDIFDQQAANVAETFLGVSHMNCILCHDGRRHLDTLSLWGKGATRMESWQLSAFLSRTSERRIAVGTMPQPYYWTVEDNTQFRTDYALNTTTGNRPPRAAVGTIRNVAPAYPFSGGRPTAGENYRAVLAREVTGDLQFARATVNYLWKEFFTKALVEPVNQFDLARLDPDNPPPEPWTLQASHPRLLNELAREFAQGGFDLKALMRQMVNSDAYQLSSRYNGAWNLSWERLFARKLVRRLWAEEIHDAVVSSSGIPASYPIPNFATVGWAMQVPEPRGLPRGDIASFLDSFMRGNREDEERRSEGSAAQALNLMNDGFVMTRTRSSGSGATASLVRRVLDYTDEQLVQALFLAVLSRYPNEAEKAVAYANLRSGNRQQKAEDLLWSLYNKVDFLFNY